MTKVVLNECYGGFGLSAKALISLIELKCEKLKTNLVNDYFQETDENIIIVTIKFYNNLYKFI